MGAWADLAISRSVAQELPGADFLEAASGYFDPEDELSQLTPRAKEYVQMRAMGMLAERYSAVRKLTALVPSYGSEELLFDALALEGELSGRLNRILASAALLNVAEGRPGQRAADIAARLSETVDGGLVALARVALEALGQGTQTGYSRPSTAFSSTMDSWDPNQ